MTTFLGRRIISAVVAAALAISGPFGIVATAAAEPASSSLRPLQAVARPSAGAPATLRARAAFGKLPLSFEANRGQTHPDVKFLSRGAGYSLFLGATEAVFVLRPSGARAEAAAPASVLRMQLVGANPDPLVTGLDERPGKANYFGGADRARWRTGVPLYGKVRYEAVYPGIDLVYYGNQRQLEYDFVVSPGADPGAIELAFEGADRLETDAQGDLVLSTSGGEARLKKPYIYQLVGGVKQPVTGGYAVRSRGSEARTAAVGFQIAAYDMSKPLVIDPVLFYSTYLGGADDDSGKGVAVDAEGNAYVTGTTLSSNFPGPGMAAAGKVPPALVPGASFDAFVAKLAVDPTTFAVSLSYASYFGGTDSDSGNAIAVDAAGNAYVTGGTKSDAVNEGFPITTGAFDKTCGTDGLCDGEQDAFVAKFDAGGSLLYSSYLGGGQHDAGYAIAVDAAGNAYVTGGTYTNLKTNTFPTTPGAFSRVDPHLDTFMTKLRPDDANTSSPCPINGVAYDDCADLLYSTYLNARGQDDKGMAIAVDAAGHVYVAGWTGAVGLPTTVNAFQATKSNGKDVFVMKLNPDDDPDLNAPCTIVDGDLGLTVDYNDCSDLLYSTYLGGAGIDTTAGDTADDDDRDGGIAVDSSGFIYVTGSTDSTDFPGPGGGTAPKLGPGASGAGIDVFVAKLNPAPATCTPVANTNITCVESLVYATYLGGTGADTGFGIAVDHAGNAYVTGSTASSDFPGPGNTTASKLGHATAGTDGAFAAKLNAAGTALVYSTVLADAGGRGIALDASCNAYVTGQSFLPGFPVLSHLPQSHLPQDSAGKINVGENADAFVTKIAQLGFRAYISNANAGTVSVIDTHTNSVGANPVQVGASPQGVAVHPSGTHVFVANAGDPNVVGDASVSVIDVTKDPATVAPVPLGTDGAAGVAVAVTPNKKVKLYVTSPNNGTVSVFDADPSSPDFKQPIGNAIAVGTTPSGIVASPDGSTIYVANVANTGSGSISVIDTETDQQIAGSPFTIPNALRPHGLAVTPKNSHLIVADANPAFGFVAIVKTSDFTLAATAGLNPLPVGGVPLGVAMLPNGSRAYVTQPVSNSVVVLDADPASATFGTVLGSPIQVGAFPYGVAVTPDGWLVYVANFHDDTVSVINTANDKRIDFDVQMSGIQDLAVGDGPVAFGRFIGFPVLDKDKDGIWDFVDVDPGDASNKTFSNKHLCGTVSGEILDTGGLVVTIESPAGLVIRTVGASGEAKIKLCDFETKSFAGNVVKPLLCGSLTALVESGPFEILLGGSGAATVPGGVTVRVAEIAPGQFEVQNLSGAGTITVNFEGQVTQVAPGGSSTFAPDSDGDGVPDNRDSCPGTPAGKAVDAGGCGGEQLVSQACSCAGPSAGGVWKNHGAYASCVAREAGRVAKSGLITHREKGAIQSQAARSTCAVK
ncbi:MAG: SBBP repeat-containing protein [Candidatus Rokubacteria bacterium]|nr:SBBP repeat-containing protein [Candidatus Rokubacteria bacterium]